MIKIAVALEKCEEGGYSASVPTLPGCFSQGESIEETLDNITEAIELHLEAVEDDLILDEDVIIKELFWYPDRSSSSFRASYQSSPRKGHAIELEPDENSLKSPGS